jgi:diguanylate cyclase (GGDEF)-like protein/PAS domain S-box-containing protein
MSSPGPSPPARGGEATVASGDVLHANLRWLESLAAGSVDAVVDHAGRTALLRRAPHHSADHAAAMQAAILNALPAHIAVLDRRGVVIAVNDAWRLFSSTQAVLAPGHGLGVDYLGNCAAARGDGSIEAHRVAEGLRSVLDGTARDFSIEYPCHSAIEQRWFVLTAIPLADNGVVVMHVDVTAERRAQASLRSSESRFRQMAESISDVFFLMDAHSNRMLYISPAYERMSGRTCESLYADPRSWTESMLTEDRASIREKYKAGIAAGKFEYECRFKDPDGSMRWMKVSGYPVRNDAGAIVRIAGMAKDITERRQAEQGLRESERRFSGMLDSVQLASVMLDKEARITYCNEYLLRLTDWKLEEVIGQNWFEMFMPAELGDMKPVFQELLADLPEAWHREHEIFTRSGERRLIRWNNSVLRSRTGAVIGTASIGEDITDQKRAEIRISHLNRVYAVLSQINALTVRVRDRHALFSEACRIAVEAGRFRMSMIGIVDPLTKKIVPVASAGDGAAFMTAATSALSSNADATKTLAAQAIREKKAVVSNDSQNDPGVLLAQHDNEAGVRSLAVLPLIVSDEAVGILVLYSAEREFFHEEEMKLLVDLTNDIAYAIDHIEKGEKLKYLAHFDALTGLANQSLFVERLQGALLESPADERKKAVFVLDVERFKTINDAFGRKAGDALLRQIAERLVQAGGGDAGRFARLGADRFAVVASDMGSVEQIGAYVEQRLDATFHAPFKVGENELRISVKVGMALFPDDAGDAETLLRNAEAALKKAKATGERYLFFTQAMTERVAEHLSLENRLRQALEKEEFVLHYQPKLNLASRELTGTEALIRWNDPRAGLVPPGMFIPILEETGLIHEVGRWAMRKAIEDYLRWRNAGLQAIRIAVNVSPLQLRNRGFIAEIQQALGVDPDAAAGLELEITESLVMEDVKHSISTLQAIRVMGVTIAIDDFGTGFSSLSYLSKLPMDTLKIDRSFVNDMTITTQGTALVATIINLAHSLQHNVVAEGVETDEQWNLLQSLGCDEMQGFLISKPLPRELFETRFLSRSAIDPKRI